MFAGRGANVAGSTEQFFVAVPTLILEIKEAVGANVTGGGGIETLKKFIRKGSTMSYKDSTLSCYNSQPKLLIKIFVFSVR